MPYAQYPTPSQAGEQVDGLVEQNVGDVAAHIAYGTQLAQTEGIEAQFR